MTGKIDKLTPEQEADLPRVRQKWLDAGLDTSPIDHEKAIESAKLAYKSADLDEPRFFIFAKGPKEAMEMLNIASECHLTEEDFVELSKTTMGLTNAIRIILEDVKTKNPKFKFNCIWPGFYGQHEAGWLGFHDFFDEHFGLSEKSRGLRDLAQNAGWVWLYNDLVVICEKPTHITLRGTVLHNEKRAAIEYRDGTKIYAFNGVVIPEKWVLEKETIDPSEILSCPDVDKRAAGIALIGYSKMKKDLNYKILEGNPNTDIGALVEITIPGLRNPGRFLEAICPRNGPVFLGVPETNPWGNDEPIRTAVDAQAFLARLPSSAYIHPPIRT